MSTDEIWVPGSRARSPMASRAAAALVIAAVFIAGVAMGRVATTSHKIPTPHRAPLLVELGPPSVGDLHRVAMFTALNEL